MALQKVQSHSRAKLPSIDYTQFAIFKILLLAICVLQFTLVGGKFATFGKRRVFLTS